ncbi:MAG: hypothetical protein PHF64_12485 [Methanoregula sp.]|nr:hypothetical protein [Methanoregula sp.]
MTIERVGVWFFWEGVGMLMNGHPHNRRSGVPDEDDTSQIPEVPIARYNSEVMYLCRGKDDCLCYPPVNFTVPYHPCHCGNFLIYRNQCTSFELIVDAGFYHFFPVT